MRPPSYTDLSAFKLRETTTDDGISFLGIRIHSVKRVGLSNEQWAAPSVRKQRAGFRPRRITERRPGRR